MKTAKNGESDIRTLFERAFRERVRKCVPLRPDGSSRLLFRMASDRRTVVGVCNSNKEENAAFVGFSRHFRALGFPVPEILAEDSARGIYLETDLGDETLALRLQRSRETGRGGESVDALYEKVVRWLPRFQALGIGGLDAALCYQGREFDAAAVRRDLDYFRECFLDLLSPNKCPTDALEKEFEELARFIDAEERPFFLYRDFQSRNVMVAGDRPFFIDYQSGRRGAAEYDLASLLYEARASLEESTRERLLETYLGEMERIVRLDRNRFRLFFPAFACVRVLQALGAYGNLGVRQGKTWFLGSIPPALANLGFLLASPRFPVDLPELRRAVLPLVENPRSLKAAIP
ncbi:MAG: phosphotransferase [Candidatus Eisenbacteria bacterium]